MNRVPFSLNSIIPMRIWIRLIAAFTLTAFALMAVPTSTAVAKKGPRSEAVKKCNDDYKAAVKKANDDYKAAVKAAPKKGKDRKDAMKSAKDARSTAMTDAKKAKKDCMAAAPKK